MSRRPSPITYSVVNKPAVFTTARFDSIYEIYRPPYQTATRTEEDKNIYRRISPDFFDLIVLDVCRSGSVAEGSAWREDWWRRP